MRKKYFILLRPLIAAIALFGFASCIGDDLEDCVDPRGNVRITLELEQIVSPETSLLEYEIDNVVVYVFDADGQYVTSASTGRYRDGYELFLTLPGGEYRFVVWTNKGEIYKANKTIEQCEIDALRDDELEFFMPCEAGANLTQNIPDLLYGQQSQRIIDARHNEVVIPMTPDTYTINVKVTGLPAMTDAFTFTVTDNNSHYTFDNELIAGKDNFHHLRTCTQSDGELNVSLKTLRLMYGRSPRFVFRNTTKSEMLFDNCLVQTIITAYRHYNEEVDFDRTHTFDIVLTYDTDMRVTVSVNGWAYKPTDYTLE